MTTVGWPVVVVFVSRTTPPPATLPEVVVVWFAWLGPSMRARQSALSFAATKLQRSIAFWRAEPVLSSVLRLRSCCAAPAFLQAGGAVLGGAAGVAIGALLGVGRLGGRGGRIGRVRRRCRIGGSGADHDQAGKGCEI
jgi:hypothetical protein